MKTKIVSSALFFLLLFSIKGNACGEDPSRTALYNLHQKITNIVASIPVSISETEDAESYLVTFRVGDDNQLSLISVEGSDEYVSMQIRKKLEGLKADGVFDHSDTFKIKVVFRKKDA